MRSKTRQLEEQDVELLKLHERNGDLGLEVQNLKEELKTERADRKTIEEQCSDMIDTIDELRSELADLKQKSDIDFDFAGKAGELVSWLRKEVGKGLPKQVTVKAVQKILEGGDN